MNQLHQLLKLQEIDNDIQAGKKRLREVLQAQKGNEKLEQARERREDSAEALAHIQRSQKALEFELQQVSSKRKRSSERLYSGKVTNPKELADLQQELESLDRRHGDLEDDLLQVMMDAEEAQEEDDEVAAEVHELEARWANKKAALAEEQNELATHLNELLAARKEQTARIEQKHLSAYERTLQMRGGVAVTVVIAGTCLSCGVRVSSSKVNAAQEGALVRCGSCDRIIVIQGG